jgi:hypothetical protein
MTSSTQLNPARVNQHSPEKLSPDHLPSIQLPSILHGVLVGSDSLWPITNNSSTNDRSKLTSLFSFCFSQQFFFFFALKFLRKLWNFFFPIENSTNSTFVK